MPRCLITANLDSFTTRSAGQKKGNILIPLLALYMLRRCFLLKGDGFFKFHSADGGNLVSNIVTTLAHFLQRTTFNAKGTVSWWI